ncbi:PIG-L deacetylase family protein [Aureimonas sp. SA4125]|uniref:PIG-L deacetylase family protein n=1 Tax=Aureimonas sp. SA4125 TaxID=2826993 RepID=UPI001CC7915F|nr:PIG-L deacetylase family protein [Aureimonas sp. SA4125]
MRQLDPRPSLDPETVAAERILVVAPHPDDESLGCGGLIATLARVGRSFHFLFVTDGGASHTGSAVWSRSALAAQREVEAADAIGRLGTPDSGRTFLRLPDAAMPPSGSDAEAEARSAVIALLADFRPELVLLPWRRDPHCDHRDTWALLHRAMAELPHPPQTLEYAIWLHELGAEGDHPHAGEAERVGYDISAAVAAKRSATAAHLSQTTALIDDDPTAFRLSTETIDRLTGPTEEYWRPLP